jgi:glycosyltransferase involved in cell wall biosynthesis
MYFADNRDAVPIVWVFSNLPPPVHGVSSFNVALLQEFQRLNVTCNVFPIGTHGDLQAVGRFRVRKLAGDLARTGQLELALMRRSRKKRSVLYFTPSQGGPGVFRDLLLTRLVSLNDVPMVAHIHGCGWLDVWKRGGLQARAMETVLRRCRAAICLGPTFADQMQAVVSTHCYSVNNGVASTDFPARREPALEKTLELLFLSNLIRSKGLWVAAQATAELKRRGVAARLRCAGGWRNEAERMDFEKTFRSELDEGVIELVGFADVERKQQLLLRAHFFLLPTHFPREGQPLSLIEAMAHGVVPITTRHAGIPDLLSFDGAEQICSDSHHSAQGIADTIFDLKANRAAYQSLSRACVFRQRADLSMEACSDSILQVLCDVA